MNNGYSVLYSVVLHIDIYVALPAINQNRSALSGFQFKQIVRLKIRERERERERNEDRGTEKMANEKEEEGRSI